MQIQTISFSPFAVIFEDGEESSLEELTPAETNFQRLSQQDQKVVRRLRALYVDECKSSR